jgi:hypothetical protein
MNKCEWTNDLQTSESGVDYNHDKKQRQNTKKKQKQQINIKKWKRKDKTLQK